MELINFKSPPRNSAFNLCQTIHQKTRDPQHFSWGKIIQTPLTQTTIPIQIPRAERVVLKIFDILGREAATLIDETLQPNEYLIPFNGTNLSSGVYFYRIQSGEFISTKKMILLK